MVSPFRANLYTVKISLGLADRAVKRNLYSVKMAAGKSLVMPGLVPGIHVFSGAKDVDGRDVARP